MLLGDKSVPVLLEPANLDFDRLPFRLPHSQQVEDRFERLAVVFHRLSQPMFLSAQLVTFHDHFRERLVQLRDCLFLRCRLQRGRKGQFAMQQDFATVLQDSISKGIGRLVDADMNEASTRLKALQTQQQLAIQSLSIANTNGENIRQLFQ